MKTLRAALILLCLAMSAQTPEPNEESRLADEQWNAMATAGNKWRTQHNGLLWSKPDHERLKKFEAEAKRFFQLAKEAKF